MSCLILAYYIISIKIIESFDFSNLYSAFSKKKSKGYEIVNTFDFSLKVKLFLNTVPINIKPRMRNITLRF
jgi:hypothetical protein